MKIFASGIGICRKRKGQILDVWYPKIWQGRWPYKLLVGEEEKSNRRISDKEITQLAGKDYFFKDLLEREQTNRYFTSEIIYFQLSSLDTVVEDIIEAYFKLHLLSYRLVLPNQLCLDNIFKVLPNIAWTSMGPVLPEDVSRVSLKSFTSNNPITVSHVDKFPYLTNYYVPSGVRIADSCRARLGAYLGDGTTIMPAGFVNFNAGTLGSAMVEGRVSQGVVVGADSDIGGGASIMGTLSGGGQEVISIGSNCLIGANAGTGISLGDGCTIAAGAYITASSKVTDIRTDKKRVVKGRELSGESGMLVYLDSQSGELVCKINKQYIELNKALHNN